ncbi:hypothetical protein [Pollutimonas sp. M17]|uniref:hypothetical protein n=1 Tax=Pollutimonas sp. M17 TaxID=2962065 RepID=UPI0021F3E718|nr:hypothetical protein [Pollutimonas sp. M17]UYO94110.1 hypothetical protein OEG81_01915 [Pollutimonas sp. M17]HWK69248.1 hypothetical protein [Burkholderiaceae bacterium]
MSARAPFLKVWGVPGLLGLLTAFGLLAALLGTGVWHGLSWLSLSIPILVAARYWIAPRK